MQEEIKNINKDVSILIDADISKLSNNGFTKVGYRKKHFLETAIILGRERDIVFPNEENHKSYFAIVELDELLASHNENNFSSTEGYPVDETGRNVNDRNYAADKNAQARVIKVSQNLNPNITISTNATASGTPIITIDGVVVSGNNRTMSIKRAKNSFPEVYDLYKKVLLEETSWGGFGIDGNVMSAILLNDDIILKGSSYNNRKSIKIKNPLLVRIDVDFSEYTSTQLNKYNKTTKKSEREIDVAIRLSQQIKENEGCKKSLIDLVSELDIVSELYNNSTYIAKYKKILLNCNIITENDIAGNFKDNTLTESGKVLYETILLGLILDAKPLEISQNSGVKSFTNNIINAIIPLIKNKSFTDGNIISEVNNAMLIKNDMVSNKYKNIAEYVTESQLFENEQEYKTDKAIILTSFIDGGRKGFKDSMISYNNSVSENSGTDMFGNSLTPNEIFDLVFTKNTDELIVKSLKTRTTQENKIVPLSAENTTSPMLDEVVVIDKDLEKRKKIEELLKKAQKYL